MQLCPRFQPSPQYADDVDAGSSDVIPIALAVGGSDFGKIVEDDLWREMPDDNVEWWNEMK